MGKYTRSKCGGSRAALGARTRSRSAAAALVGPGAAKRRKQEPEPEASTAARAEADALPGQQGCYLHLRSRKLFMPVAAPPADLGAEEASTAMLARAPGEEAALLGISRCSSTASSTVDAAARETTGAEAEEGDDAVEPAAAGRLEQRPGVEPGDGRAEESQPQEVSGDDNSIPLTTTESEDAGRGGDRRVLRRRREGAGRTLRRQVQLRRRAGRAARRRPVRVDAGGRHLRRRPCELAMDGRGAAGRART